MPQYNITNSVKGFKGIHNRAPSERIPAGFVQELINMDVDDTEALSLREGYTQVDAGQYNNLFFVDAANSIICTRGVDLYRLDALGLYPELLLPSVISSPSERVGYFIYQEDLYFSSDNVAGIFPAANMHADALQTLSMEEPQASFNLTNVTTGILLPGTYRVVITSLFKDGRESPASLENSITVTTGGILIENLPAVSYVDQVGFRIYCTQADGSVFLLCGTVLTGDSEYLVSTMTHATVPLATLNTQKFPCSPDIGMCHGLAFSFRDNVCYFSLPYTPHLFRYADDFLMSETPIKDILPVSSGTWVLTDTVNYLQGTLLQSAKWSERDAACCVKGSGVKVPGDTIFINNTPIGYKWLVLSDKGVLVLFDDGIVLNLTSKHYAYDKYQEGVGLFTNSRGVNKYLTILKNPAPQHNAHIRDVFSGQIIRNGVVVQE